MVQFQNIDIAEGTPEDTVQFVKHLEENLDPNDDYESTVWIETVRFDEVDELPGEEIPTRGSTPERGSHGVRVYAEFDENNDAPSRRVSTLARGFYEASNKFTLNSSFDGGAGEFEAYVFPITE